jgi:hypothetical protein
MDLRMVIVVCADGSVFDPNLEMIMAFQVYACRLCDDEHKHIR